MTNREKTYELVNDMSLDELTVLMINCRPDRKLLARKIYGFVPDKTTVEEAVADYILLEM